ncbi:hypothetical protein ES695_07240 [Candidatus Atribacteria bacterium 1244-E10-H5-B2]|nr:MAG: hypothetical protein ES695_07240 [Candidatus Atribacteria bacterium 1244-E10-H5-B2]
MGEEDKEISLNDEEFAEAIEKAGLSKSLNNYTAKIADKRTSEGIETYKKNQGEKELSDKERLQEVEKELSEMKSNNAKSSLNNSIKKALKEADLGEGFAQYIKVDKEEDIENAVKDLRDNILEQKQESIDKKLKEGDIPLKGEQTFTGSGMETEAKDYAKKISIKEE